MVTRLFELWYKLGKPTNIFKCNKTKLKYILLTSVHRLWLKLDKSGGGRGVFIVKRRRCGGDVATRTRPPLPLS
jgi:hypothetical protein